MPFDEGHVPDIKLVQGQALPMPSHQRIKLLKEWASGQRKSDSDIIARIALDEIDELHLHIISLNMELNRAKAAGFRG